MTNQVISPREAELQEQFDALKAVNCSLVETCNDQSDKILELEHQLQVAQQGWKCECSTDDACRFARERDAAQAEAARLKESATLWNSRY